MRNIDKVWKIWSDLDASYTSDKGTKKEFLCSLVAMGDKDNIYSVLAKIANDIDTQSIEDMNKYNKIQSLMIAVLENYNMIPDVILSLSEYVTGLVGTGSKKSSISFEEFTNMLICRPCILPSWDFDVSSVGCELITADNIHKVKLVSTNAVIVPVWLQHADQLELTNSSLHSKIRKLLLGKNKEIRKPVIFIGRSAVIKNKAVVNDCINCGGGQIDIRRI